MTKNFSLKDLENTDLTNSKVLEELFDNNIIDEKELFRLLGKKTELKDLKSIIAKSEKLKKCKWCQKSFVDTDDFCSPECLEKYAKEFLQKQ